MTTSSINEVYVISSTAAFSNADSTTAAEVITSTPIDEITSSKDFSNIASTSATSDSNTIEAEALSTETNIPSVSLTQLASSISSNTVSEAPSSIIPTKTRLSSQISDTLSTNSELSTSTTSSTFVLTNSETLQAYHYGWNNQESSIISSSPSLIVSSTSGLQFQSQLSSSVSPNISSGIENTAIITSIQASSTQPITQSPTTTEPSANGTIAPAPTSLEIDVEISNDTNNLTNASFLQINLINSNSGNDFQPNDTLYFNFTVYSKQTSFKTAENISIRIYDPSSKLLPLDNHGSVQYFLDDIPNKPCQSNSSNHCNDSISIHSNILNDEVLINIDRLFDHKMIKG